MFEREKYNFRLDNPQQTGAVVGSVKATDGDLTAPNNVIGSYQMERSAEGFFYVDAKSGAITAGEKLRTELYDEYSFSVTARDTGDPSLQVSDENLSSLAFCPAAAGYAFSGPPRKSHIDTTRALPVGRRMPDTGSPIRDWVLLANRGGEPNQCASTL